MDGGVLRRNPDLHVGGRGQEALRALSKCGAFRFCQDPRLAVLKADCFHIQLNELINIV